MTVTSHVLAASGTLQATGVFEKRGLRRHLDPAIKGMKLEIPHVHRLSPNNAWLASFHATRRELQLRSMGNDRPTGPISIKVRKLPGQIETFRWLSDSSGVVFQTTAGLYLARLDLSGERRGVAVKRLVIEKHRPATNEIIDFRILPGGLIARSYEHLYYVHIADSDRLVIHDLTPRGDEVIGHSIMAGGEIAMIARKRRSRKTTLWMFAPRDRDRASVPVLTGISPYLYKAPGNWATGSESPIVATWDDSILIQRPGPMGPPSYQRLTVSETYTDTNSLWTSKDGKRILAAGSNEVYVWNRDGTELWRWKPSKSQSVRSAHFEADSRSVLIATNSSLLRVRDGKIISDALDDKQRQALGLNDGTSAFLEGAIPLPNGSIAFNVVRETRLGTAYRPRRSSNPSPRLQKNQVRKRNRK